MIRAVIKLFLTVFVALPMKLLAVGLKFGGAMLKAFLKLITLPIRIIL